MSEVDLEIEGMKQALGVTLDRELASALDLDPSSIASWRRRGTVPPKYQIRFGRKVDESAIPSNALRRSLRRTYVFALVSLLAKRIFEESFYLGPHAGDFELARTGHILSTAHDKFEDYLDYRLTKDALRERFQSAKELLRKLDIDEWVADDMPITHEPP